jgi:hypothetical protein
MHIPSKRYPHRKTRLDTVVRLPPGPSDEPSDFCGDKPAPIPPECLDLLLGDIVASYATSNSDLFLSSVRRLSDYIECHRTVSCFNRLVQEDIIRILLMTTRGDPMTSTVRACLRCIFLLPTVFQDSMPALLDMELLPFCREWLAHPPNTALLNACVTALSHLIADRPALIVSLPAPSYFTSLGGNGTYCHIGKLLLLFCRVPLPPGEVDALLSFFVGPLLLEPGTDEINETLIPVREVARDGLHEMLENRMISARHHRQLEVLPDLLEFDDAELGVPHVRVQACQIVAGLLRACVHVLNFDIREAIALCRGDCDLDVRIAAYELLETRAYCCEADTIEMLILMPETFEAIVEGVRDAPFQIRASSAATLMQLIDGGQRLTQCLTVSSVIEALILLLEDERWRPEAIKRIHLIFERCRLYHDDDVLHELLESWNAFETIHAVFDDAEAADLTKVLANRVLTRLSE